MVRFFAGFCLVANGVYLSAGAWTGDGDAGDLLSAGATSWQLICFGFFATALGLRLWHRLGSDFGFGNQGERVRWSCVNATSIFLVTTVVLELALSSRG